MPPRPNLYLPSCTADLVALSAGKRASSLPRHHLDQARDRFERSIGLQDREEDLVRALISGRPIFQRDAAEIERRTINGVEKLFPRRFAIHALERFDHEPSDQITFQRNEARLGVRLI